VPVVSVYPDHGESVYGDTEIHLFKVSAREYSPYEIQDEIDIDLYDEFLVFSLDWDNVQATDIKLQKQPDGSFQTLNTSLFNAPGFYYFWWKAPYIDYEGYVQASDSYWHVKDVPKIKYYEENPIFNKKLESLELLIKTGINDEFKLFLSTPDWSNALATQDIQISNNRLFLHIWFPESSYYYISLIPIVFLCIFVGEVKLKVDIRHGIKLGKVMETLSRYLWII